MNLINTSGFGEILSQILRGKGGKLESLMYVNNIQELFFIFDCDDGIVVTFEKTLRF
jgi:hypothetical protein